MAWTVAMVSSKSARAMPMATEVTVTMSMVGGVIMLKIWVDADRVTARNPSQIELCRPNQGRIWASAGRASWSRHAGVMLSGRFLVGATLSGWI
jgi:hypothetical protein